MLALHEDAKEQSLEPMAFKLDQPHKIASNIEIRARFTKNGLQFFLWIISISIKSKKNIAPKCYYFFSSTSSV